MNGWQIAGRTLGIASLVIVTATSKSPAPWLDGIVSGLFWWAILEFIGWRVSLWQAEASADARTPSIVFSNAEDVIRLREYELAHVAQVDAENESQRLRELEHAAALERERLKSLAECAKQEAALSDQKMKAQSVLWRRRYRVCKAVLLYSRTPFLLAILAIGFASFGYAAVLHAISVTEQRRRSAENSRSSVKTGTATLTEPNEKPKIAMSESAALFEQQEKQKIATELEVLRAAYVAAQRTRLEAEADLVKSLSGTPFVSLPSVEMLSVHALKTEPSRLGLEMCQQRLDAWKALHAEMVNNRNGIEKLLSLPQSERVYRMHKLEMLYTDTRRRVEAAQTINELNKFFPSLRLSERSGTR